MATINELANIGGNLEQGVSTAVTQPQQIGRANYVVGDSLANDLSKVLRPAAKTVQAQNTASVKAANRVVMDKKTALASFMAEPENVPTEGSTPAELRAIQQRQQDFYLSQGTTFENEDAQNSFDSGYTRDMGLAVAQSNAKLETRALKGDAINNRTMNTDAISTQLSAGLPIPTTQINEHVDSITAGGYFTKDQAYGDIAYAMNVSLNEKYKINKNLPIYNVDGSVNGEMQSEEFNKNYGSMMTMDENGNVTKVGGTTDKAATDIMNNWKSLKSAHVAKKTTFNAEFERFIRESKKTNSNNNTAYVPSQDIQGQIDSKVEQFRGLESQFDLTAQQYSRAEAEIADLYDAKEVSSIVENDILSDPDIVKTYLEDGRIVDNFLFNDTGETGTFKISADKYKSIVNKRQEDLSKSLFTVDITPENEGQFEAGLAELDKWEQLSGSTSAFSKTYDKLYDESSTPFINDAQGLKQALAYHSYRQINNEAYQGDSLYMGKLEALLAKEVDGKPLSSLQMAREANQIVTVEKNTRQSRTSSKELDLAVREGMEAVETGEGFFGTLFTLEAVQAKGTITAVKKYIDANGLWANAKEETKALQYTDYGTLVLGDDQRVAIPIGVKESVFKSALHKVRKNYNKRTGEDFDEADVVLETVYDKKTNNFITNMYSKKNFNVLIGSLDKNSAEITAGKE